MLIIDIIQYNTRVIIQHLLLLVCLSVDRMYYCLYSINNAGNLLYRKYNMREYQTFKKQQAF